ncbi:hypothetical protein ACIPM2_32030 [Streptomyces sp. NPDC086081]
MRKSSLRKKTTAVLAGVGAVTALTVAVSPADAASSFTPRNGATGKCLAGWSGHTVAQAHCGDASTSWSWVEAGTNRGMYKNTSTGMCLDTNGDGVYLSPCNSADGGQVWGTWDGCTLWKNHVYNRYLTGWNTGTVSMRNYNDVDSVSKQHWFGQPC